MSDQPTPDYSILDSSIHLIKVTQAEQYPATHPFRDKAFITARISISTLAGELMTPEMYLAAPPSTKIGTIVLNIGHDTPVATLNKDLADAYRQQNKKGGISTVPDIRSGQADDDHWLISGGMLIHDPHGKLILFERTERMGGKPDGKVIAWPKAFNNPMGRCDDLPGRVCLKEGAQELMAYSTPDGNIISHTGHMFQWGRETGITLAEEMDLQAKVAKEFLKREEIFRIHDTSLIEARPHPGFHDQLVTVATHVNGVLRESFRAVAALSPAERTLELAIPAQLHDPQGRHLSFIAREPFGRKTTMLSREQLEAAHYGWALGAFGTVHDDQQNRKIHLGGVLPILQCGVLGQRVAVSRPEEVVVPAEWTVERARHMLGLER